MSSLFDRWMAAVPVSTALATEQQMRAQAARIASEIVRCTGIKHPDIHDVIGLADWLMTGQAPARPYALGSDLNSETEEQPHE